MTARFLIILFAVMLAGCGSKQENTSTGKTDSDTKIVQTSDGSVLNVDLPTVQCSMCKKTIESSLKGVEGVKDVKVNVKDKKAAVTIDASLINLEKVENTITAAGYDANGKTSVKEAYENLHDCCKKPEDRKDKSGSHE